MGKNVKAHGQRRSGTTKSRESTTQTPDPISSDLQHNPLGPSHKWFPIACFVAIAVLYVILRVPGIGVPLDRDEGAFGYMGQLINHGDLPYRDGIDHKPPVAFYINAAALRIVPATEKGVHGFLLVYNFLTLLLVFQIGRIYFQSVYAGLWCAFSYCIFSASPAIQGFSASTEMWSLLPISLSLLLVVLDPKSHRYLYLVGSGVAGALACWTKQTAFTSILFVFLFLIAETWHREPRPGRIIGPLVWLSGAVGISSCILLYFYARGIFHEFLYWSMTYGFTYAGQAVGEQGRDLWGSRLMEIAGSAFPLLLAGAGAIVWSWARRRQFAYFIAALMAFSLLGTVPGFAYRHYFAQIAPALALASGYGLFLLTKSIRTPTFRILVGSACVALIVVVAIGSDSSYFFERDPNVISRAYHGDNPFPEARAIGQFLAGMTQPNDKIFITGSEPEVLFYAQRRSPSSFLMIYPLLNNHSRYREFQQKMLTEINNDPPKYILDVLNIPYSLGWDGVADLGIFHEFENLLRQRYEAKRVMLVTGSQGTWVDVADSRLSQNNPFIVLYQQTSRLPAD